MDRNSAKPTKTNKDHQKQMVWQILVPIAIGALIVLGVAVVVSLSASGQVPTVQAWSSATSIMLVIPVCFGGLLTLAILLLLIFGMSKLLKVTSPYMRVVQNYIAAAGIYIQIALDKVAGPVLKTHSQRAAWLAFWQNIIPKKSK